MHGLDLKDKHIILAGSTRYLIQTRVSRGRRRGTSTSPSMMCAIINLKQPNLLPERKQFEWMWKWTSANPNLRAHSHARFIESCAVVHENNSFARCPAGWPDVAHRRPGSPAGCGRTRARPSRGTARVAGGARSPPPPVRGAAAAVGVARRGPRPLPNVAPRRPVGRRRRRRTPRPAVRRGRGYFRPRGMEGGVEAGSVCVAGGAVDFLGGWFGFFCSFSFDGCGGGGAGCRAWLLREDGDLQG